MIAIPNVAHPFAIGALVVLTSCVGLPPKPASPDLPASVLLAQPQALTTQATGLPISSLGATWPAHDWWRGFKDDTLNTLILQALAASPDIALAQARFDVARAATDETAAPYRPQLESSADASRQRLSADGLFPTRLLGFSWYNQFDLGLRGSYTLGNQIVSRTHRRITVSAELASAAERDAAALALAGSIVSLYYGWHYDQARLQLVNERLTTLNQAAKIYQARANAQIARVEDERTVEIEQLETREQQSELEDSADLRRVALAALVGCAPQTLPPFTVQALPVLTQALPANASLDLIARRADIIAARWRVEATLGERDSARRKFYPDISLSALLGFSSLHIGQLLGAATATPLFATALHLPIFDGGALRARYAASQAQLTAAVAQYQGTIVAAAREVNTQLATRSHDFAHLSVLAQEVAAADSLRGAAMQRANAGLTDARPVFTATVHWLRLREALLVGEYTHLGTELALIRALGGGYHTDLKL